MFGFARSRRLALSRREIRTENAYYCGLCHTLRHDYGAWASVLTNFEGRFLALLVDAQISQKESLMHRRCPLPPFANHRAASYNVATRFAAAMTLYLFQQKLLDDLEDDGSKAAHFLLQLGEQRWEQAKSYLDSIEFPFVELEGCRRAQRETEQTNCSLSLQDTLEPSAQAMGLIFAFTSDLAQAPENRETLLRIGAEVGKLVCLLDACQDYDRDLRRGHFNPILQCRNKEVRELVPTGYRQVINVFADSFSRIQTEVSKLRLADFPDLVENTLTSGLAQQTKRVLRLMPYRLRWSKLDIDIVYQYLSFLPDTNIYHDEWKHCIVSLPRWKTWLMEQEVRLRTGWWADLVQPIWPLFRLEKSPDSSQELFN
jgi:hypothetical protein